MLFLRTALTVLIQTLLDERQRFPVSPNDGAAPHDPGRAVIPAQRPVYCDENRGLPHEGETKTLFQVGHHLRGAVHGSRQG